MFTPVYISDHLHILCLTDKRKPHKKTSEPLIFKHRPISEVATRYITSALQNTDWTYLHQLDVNNAFREITKQPNCVIIFFAPGKNVNIKSKYVVRNLWMTKGLMKSSITSNKLYRKCIGKSRVHPTYIRYVNYRNLYNKLKQTSKITYYANLFNTSKNDSKKTWQLLKTMIGKHNDKSCIPTCFKYNNGLSNDPDQISNTFCNFVTDIGPNYANAIRCCSGVIDSESWLVCCK